MPTERRLRNLLSSIDSPDPAMPECAVVEIAVHETLDLLATDMTRPLGRDILPVVVTALDRGTSHVYAAAIAWPEHVPSIVDCIVQGIAHSDKDTVVLCHGVDVAPETTQHLEQRGVEVQEYRTQPPSSRLADDKSDAKLFNDILGYPRAESGQAASEFIVRNLMALADAS